MKTYIAALTLIAAPAFAAGSPNYYDPLPAGSTPGSIPSSAIIAPGNNGQTIINSGGLLAGSDIISASAINSSGSLVINSVGSMTFARNGATQLTIGTNTASTISGFVVGNILNVTGNSFMGNGSATPSATVHISGTLLLSAQTVTPTASPLGRIAMNTSGTLCIVSASNVYVKVASPGTACGFGAGSN